MVEYINWLRATVTTTGAADFEEVEISLPSIMAAVAMPNRGRYNPTGKVNKTYAFIIHSIRVYKSRGFAADGETSSWQLTKTTQTDILTQTNSAVIEQVNDTAEGAAYITKQEDRFDYRIPVLVSVPKLYFAGKHSAAACTYRITIGYTIREVDDRDFLAGLAQ